MLEWRDKGRTEDLFLLALEWLREDRDLRREREKEAGRVRGPKVDVSAFSSSQLLLTNVNRLETPRHSSRSTITPTSPDC